MEMRARGRVDVLDEEVGVLEVGKHCEVHRQTKGEIRLRLTFREPTIFETPGPTVFQ